MTYPLHTHGIKIVRAKRESAGSDPGQERGVPGLLSIKTTVSGMVRTGAEGILTVPLPGRKIRDRILCTGC
jgi:hypothetical protein